jgi:hypothetical protein
MHEWSGLSPEERLAKRFWNHVPDQPGLDCWEWVGLRFSNGYGRLKSSSDSARGSKRRKILSAHRVAFQLCCASIPVGMDVCHACDNRGCVNPQHLFVGTRKENMQDAKAKGRLVQMGKRKSRCINGHAYSDDNIIYQSNGGRRCKACQRAAERRYKMKISKTRD